MQITPISRTVGQDRVRVPPSSVPPKVLEPVGRQFGIPDRVLDVLVPEVVLQSPCVGTLGGRPEALDKPMETDG